jgi:LPS sulfotransferase NodH
MNFVLLTTQRTGSTWVRTSLNSHPEIASYGELFLESGRGFPSRAQFAPLDTEFFESRLARSLDHAGPLSRARLCVSYLDDLYGRPRKEGVVGFKLMYSQLKKNPVLFGYFLAKRVRVLHLTRRNVLDIVVSDALAKARGQSHVVEGDSIRKVAIRLDPQLTRRRIAELERQIALIRFSLRVSPLSQHELVYEQLRAERAGLAQALRFLGLDESQGEFLTSSLKKLGSGAKSEAILNWDELERSLRNTRFAHYLGDGDWPGGDTSGRS